MFVNELEPNVELYVKAGMAISKKRRFEILFFGIFTLAMGLFFTLLFNLYLHKSEGAVPWILFIIGGALVIYRIMFKKLMRKHLSKGAQPRSEKIRYEFSDEGFEFSSYSYVPKAEPQPTTNEAQPQVSDVHTKKGDYSTFTECKEYREFWLLYYNKTSFEVLAKDGMTKGTAPEFSEFLISKLGDKYKVLFKRK